LNARDKEQLQGIGITDHTSIVMEANRVPVKQRLMESVNYKVNNMIQKMSIFKVIFDDVIRKGLPTFWDGNGELYNLDQYK